MVSTPVEVLPLVDRVVERRGLLLVDDLAADSVVGESEEAPEAGAVLAMAASDELGTLLGVLIAKGHTPRSWTNTDIERAGDVAAAITSFLVIDKLRRHAEHRVNAEIRARELRLQMHNIASQSASASSLPELAQVLVTETPGLLGCDWTVVAYRWAGTEWRVDFADSVHRPALQAFFAIDTNSGDGASAGTALLDFAERRSAGRFEISPQTCDQFSIVKAAFADSDTASITTVPISHSDDGLAAVMLCSFSSQDLGVRTDYLLDELVSDVQDAVERTASAQREGHTAAMLQRSLLPPRVPALADFEVRTIYHSAADHTRVGGDWYDIVQISDQVTGFIVGDVAGHDIRSAALMGQVRHVLASQLRDRKSPAAALGATDRYFADLAEDVMATAAVIVVDQNSGTSVVSLAGHPPPVVIQNGAASLVEVTPGPPMGFGYGGHLDTPIRLGLADVFISYTDGVIENRVGDLEELLTDFVTAIQAVPQDVDELITFIDKRSQLGELVDDVAALVVQLTQHASS
jgi:hypothetical protein